MGHLLVGQFQARIATRSLTALADPFGMAALKEVTRYWTAVELSARLIGVPTLLLWTCLLWILVGLAVLAGLHARFRLAHPQATSRRAAGGGYARDPDPERVAPVAVPSVPRSFEIWTRAWPVHNCDHRATTVAAPPLASSR